MNVLYGMPEGRSPFLTSPYTVRGRPIFSTAHVHIHPYAHTSYVGPPQEPLCDNGDPEQQRKKRPEKKERKKEREDKTKIHAQCKQPVLYYVRTYIYPDPSSLVMFAKRRAPHQSLTGAKVRGGTTRDDGGAALPILPLLLLLLSLIALPLQVCTVLYSLCICECVYLCLSALNYSAPWWKLEAVAFGRPPFQLIRSFLLDWAIVGEKKRKKKKKRQKVIADR